MELAGRVATVGSGKFEEELGFVGGFDFLEEGSEVDAGFEGGIVVGAGERDVAGVGVSEEGPAVEGFGGDYVVGFFGLLMGGDADGEAEVGAVGAGELELEGLAGLVAGDLGPAEVVASFPGGVDYGAVEEVDAAVFGPLFAPGIDDDVGAALPVGEGHFSVVVEVEVVGDSAIAIEIDADLVIVSHTSDSVAVAAGSPFRPDVLAGFMLAIGNGDGDFLEFSHTAVEGHDAADGFLIGFGLIAIEEPAAGFVELGHGVGGGVAVAGDAVFHCFAPDGVAIGPDTDFIEADAAVGLGGGDADALGDFPTVVGLGAFVLGAVHHVPGEVSGEAGGIGIGDGAIEDVHLVGEDGSDGSELATGAPFLFVDGGELRAGGIVDAGGKSFGVGFVFANVGSGGVGPGIVVFSERRWPGEVAGVGGVGLVCDLRLSGTSGDERDGSDEAFHFK